MRKNEEKPSDRPAQPESDVQAMITRYGNAEEFMKTFNDEMQLYIEKAKARAYIGDAPTLACMAKGYGQDNTIFWMSTQIDSVNTSSGAKRKMEPKAIRMLALDIYYNHNYLRATEFILFLGRIRHCRYKGFYGESSAMVFNESLRMFITERNEELHRLRCQQLRAQQAAAAPDPNRPRLTLDQWLALRKARGDNRPLQSLHLFLPHLRNFNVGLEPETIDDDPEACFDNDRDPFDDRTPFDRPNSYNPFNPDDDDDLEACLA